MPTIKYRRNWKITILIFIEIIHWRKEHQSLLNCERLLLFSCSFTFNLLQPHVLQPAKLLCPRNFPGKSTGVVYHFLLQGIFLTQGSNPCLCISCIVRRFFTAEPLGNQISARISKYYPTDHLSFAKGKTWPHSRKIWWSPPQPSDQT